MFLGRVSTSKGYMHIVDTISGFCFKFGDQRVLTIELFLRAIER